MNLGSWVLVRGRMLGTPSLVPRHPLMDWSSLYVGDLRHVLPSVAGSLQGEWGLRKTLGVYGEFGV
jgi:hypothetical protein